MRVAIIPARGGSKRIPRKNVKLFNGRPAISYPIEVAIAARCFDRIIVSTDDDEIAQVALRYGADVPFMRPLELSDDYATTMDVVQHAIESLELQGQHPEWVCCIYATAIFLQSDDLCRGWDLLQRQDADFAFSVTSYAFPIQRAIRITQDGKVAMFQPEYQTTRSQDLEHAYHDAGQFYWGKAAAFSSRSPIFSERAVPVVLPRYRVQDIDTQEDWVQAELMYQAITSAK